MTNRYEDESARPALVGSAPTSTEQVSAKLHQWRLAKQVTLGFLLAFGLVQTAHEFSARCREARQVVPTDIEHVINYSGIGVALESRDGHHVVAQVFPGSPADGVIFPGAVLISVDGERPGCASRWARMIRGPEGTSVALNVAYPGRGHEEITLIRQRISLRTQY
jgi:hypothetical protein